VADASDEALVAQLADMMKANPDKDYDNVLRRAKETCEERMLEEKGGGTAQEPDAALLPTLATYDFTCPDSNWSQVEGAYLGGLQGVGTCETDNVACSPEAGGVLFTGEYGSELHPGRGCYLKTPHISNLNFHCFAVRLKFRVDAAGHQGGWILVGGPNWRCFALCVAEDRSLFISLSNDSNSFLDVLKGGPKGSPDKVELGAWHELLVRGVRGVRGADFLCTTPPTYTPTTCTATPTLTTLPITLTLTTHLPVHRHTHTHHTAHHTHTHHTPTSAPLHQELATHHSHTNHTTHHAHTHHTPTSAP